MSTPIRLFEAFGIELEYMIVHSGDLSVNPISDRILRPAAVGDPSGTIALSNELVMHVLEFKVDSPAPILEPLPAFFHAQVRRVNAFLARHHSRLLPTGMHPMMDPRLETRLWPYNNREIYQVYNAIFGCRGHGWSNLQSVHLNLPFAGNDEFGRLHAAVRLVLPLIPALAASSPMMDGRPTGIMDTRLDVYKNNQKQIPLIAGQIIPERVFSRRDYEEKILKPMYSAVKLLDPGGVIQEEWLNSRGAIARFERDTIEIRLMDSQECVLADLAVAAVVALTVQALAGGPWVPYKEQVRWSEERLAAIYSDAVRDGHGAVIRDAEFLRVLGMAGDQCPVREIWYRIVDRLHGDGLGHATFWKAPLQVILKQGCLAARILKALDGNFSRDNIIRVYARLADCLEQNRLFMAE